MFLFSPKHKLRRFCVFLSRNTKFEFFLIICILFSCCLLAIDNPLIDPKDKMKTVLNYMDMIFTCIFILEILIKVLAMGLIGSKESYLRNAWNILDFLIVAGASISSFGISNQNMSIIKTFRLTRILRPLRLISKNEGLKITINSLIRAIPNIFNLVMLISFFFLLFGILGINLFKGFTIK